jgi:hypothetical protein
MTDKNAITKPPLTLGQLVTWLSLAAMVVMVFIALSNWDTFIHLHVFGYRFSVSLGLMLIISLVSGSFAGISDYLTLNRSGRQDQIQQRWQAQDAKLAASVTSDREQQLEAKIKTLETALEKALKKDQ